MQTLTKAHLVCNLITCPQIEKLKRVVKLLSKCNLLIAASMTRHTILAAFPASSKNWRYFCFIKLAPLCNKFGANPVTLPASQRHGLPLCFQALPTTSSTSGGATSCYCRLLPPCRCCSSTSSRRTGKARGGKRGGQSNFMKHKRW